MKTSMRIAAVLLFCGLPTVGVAADGFAAGTDVGDLGSCEESGHTDQSARACTAIIQAKKETTANLAKAYQYRGYVYYWKSDYKRALADYNEAIRLNPTNVWFFVRRAHLYENTKDLKLELADFAKVIELRPDLGYKRRAGVYVREKDFDRAAADFDQAIRLAPKDASIVKDRAEAYVAKGDLDGAIAAYGDVLKLEPEYAHAFQGRGYAYYLKGDYDRAIADYDEAARLPGMIPTGLLFYYRAKAYEKTGDLGRAIADYEQAIKIDPDYSAAKAALRDVRKRLGFKR